MEPKGDTASSISDVLVRTMYSSFPTETLEEMLAFDLAKVDAPQVKQLNAAIRRKIERRKEPGVG